MEEKLDSVITKLNELSACIDALESRSRSRPATAEQQNGDIDSAPRSTNNTSQSDNLRRPLLESDSTSDVGFQTLCVVTYLICIKYYVSFRLSFLLFITLI